MLNFRTVAGGNVRFVAINTRPGLSDLFVYGRSSETAASQRLLGATSFLTGFSGIQSVDPSKHPHLEIVVSDRPLAPQRAVRQWLQRPELRTTRVSLDLGSLAAYDRGKIRIVNQGDVSVIVLPSRRDVYGRLKDFFNFG